MKINNSLNGHTIPMYASASTLHSPLLYKYDLVYPSDYLSVYLSIYISLLVYIVPSFFSQFFLYQFFFSYFLFFFLSLPFLFLFHLHYELAGGGSEGTKTEPNKETDRQEAWCVGIQAFIIICIYMWIFFSFLVIQNVKGIIRLNVLSIDEDKCYYMYACA